MNGKSKIVLKLTNYFDELGIIYAATHSKAIVDIVCSVHRSFVGVKIEPGNTHIVDKTCVMLEIEDTRGLLYIIFGTEGATALEKRLGQLLQMDAISWLPCSSMTYYTADYLWN